MMKYFFIFMLLTGLAQASDITDAFTRKDYHTITDVYRDSPERNFTQKELVYISFSLRHLDFFRQDIKMNVKLINKLHKDLHTKLIESIRNGVSVDGDDYPEALKIMYYNLVSDFRHIILGYEEKSPQLAKDSKHFTTFVKILGQLEFREGKVDKMNDEVIAHLQYLDNKIYHFSSSISLNYLSWQQTASLHGNGNDTTLVITNKGFCAGGDVGYENYLFHFYVDGCFMAGTGNVQASQNKAGIVYQQSNVGAYGAKISPGASMIVSSTKSRIGFRIPIIYSHQPLQDPTDNRYQALDNAPISVVTSLYSRWQFNKWYFSTEFGQYVKKQQTVWSLGIGYTY